MSPSRLEYFPRPPPVEAFAGALLCDVIGLASSGADIGISVVGEVLVVDAWSSVAVDG